MKFEEFGMNLAKARINANLSAYELSLRIGKDASYIYKVESTIGSTVFKAETNEGAYDEKDTGADYTAEDPVTYTAGIFNKAEDLAGNEVWVLYVTDKTDEEKTIFKGVYSPTTETVSDGSSELNGKTIYKRLTPKTETEYGKIYAFGLFATG